MLLAEDIPIPLIRIENADGKIDWVNQAAQEWLGRSMRTLQNRYLADLFTDAEQIISAGRRSQSDMSPVTLHDQVVRRQSAGDEIADLTVFSHEGQIHVLAQVKAHQPVRSQTGSLAASAMGRMLAHEIKNPLAGIHGAAQLLRDDVDTEEGQALIDLIASETNRIRRLSDRMESLGDRDPKNETHINIHEILIRARQIVENSVGNNIKFSETYDPSLPPVLGDPDTLMQAILNLIKNAAEALEEHTGEKEIRLETAFRSGVIRRTSPDMPATQLPIEIKVIDNGPGVGEAIRDRLFQPFITNKPTGQGLGLSLVSKVATAHGGLVEHQSKPGHTAFSILLPVSDNHHEDL